MTQPMTRIEGDAARAAAAAHADIRWGGPQPIAPQQHAFEAFTATLRATRQASHAAQGQPQPQAAPADGSAQDGTA